MRHGPRRGSGIVRPFPGSTAPKGPDQDSERGRLPQGRFYALLMQSTGVNRARSGRMGQGPEQATPDALGIEQAGPKKLGKGLGRRTGRTKSPGITLARQPKSWGNTLLIVMVSGVFLCL